LNPGYELFPFLALRSQNFSWEARVLPLDHWRTKDIYNFYFYYILRCFFEGKNKGKDRGIFKPDELVKLKKN